MFSGLCAYGSQLETVTEMNPKHSSIGKQMKKKDTWFLILTIFRLISFESDSLFHVYEAILYIRRVITFGYGAVYINLIETFLLGNILKEQIMRPQTFFFPYSCLI